MTANKRIVVSSVLITAVLVTSLVAMAQPTVAANVTVSGPDTVHHPSSVEFTSVTELSDESELTALSVSYSPVDGDESDVVTFDVALDGTVLGSNPERGTIGAGEIRIVLLERGLTITPSETESDVGYGYGYGYGYGDERLVAFSIAFDTRAFKAGEYEIRVSVETDSGETVSDANRFTVMLPSESTPPGHAPSHDRSPPGHAASHDSQRGDVTSGLFSSSWSPLAAIDSHGPDLPVWNI